MAVLYESRKYVHEVNQRALGTIRVCPVFPQTAFERAFKSLMNELFKLTNRPSINAPCLSLLIDVLDVALAIASRIAGVRRRGSRATGGDTTVPRAEGVGAGSLDAAARWYGRSRG
jgi:hypothetical protein